MKETTASMFLRQTADKKYEMTDYELLFFRNWVSKRLLASGLR